ncbi:hypothetical protein PIB30_095590 [Stylosanthes scabra]|uniref:Uncharacterized protein n=1 Tax=Stylosanthes scabra TaxID=79078 RepID=A0ABU6SY72_9FABA|nr:hypothetical protein [Stylosanthes scabra]
MGLVSHLWLTHVLEETWFYSLLVGSDGMLWSARKTHRGQLIIALKYGTNVILGCWWSCLVLGRKHEVTFDELVSPNVMNGRLGLAFGLVLEDACHVWDLTPNVTWEGTKHEGNEA